MREKIRAKPNITKEFTMDWYKELGWAHNPFEHNIPEPVDQFFSNRDIEKQRLNYFVIEQFSFGTIKGESGSGKSILLSWLFSELIKFKSRSAVAFINPRTMSDKEIFLAIISAVTSLKDKVYMTSFYNFKLHKAVDYLKLKMGLTSQDNSFFKKIAERTVPPIQDILVFFQEKLGKRRLFILIDDAGNLTAPVYNFLEQLVSHNVPLSIIAADSLDRIQKSGLSGLKLEDKTDISLQPLSYPAVREMLRLRIEHAGGSDIEPFNDVDLASLWDSSKKNPKSMIKLSYEESVKRALQSMKDSNKPKKQELPEEVEDAIPSLNIDIPAPEYELKESKKEEKNYKFNVKSFEEETIELPLDEIESAKKKSKKKK